MLFRGEEYLYLVKEFKGVLRDTVVFHNTLFELLGALFTHCDIPLEILNTHTLYAPSNYKCDRRHADGKAIDVRCEELDPYELGTIINDILIANVGAKGFIIEAHKHYVHIEIARSKSKFMKFFKSVPRTSCPHPSICSTEV